MKLKASLMVSNLELTHLDEFVVARTKKISIVVSPEVSRIIPKSQDNVEIVTRTTRNRSHS